MDKVMKEKVRPHRGVVGALGWGRHWSPGWLGLAVGVLLFSPLGADAQPRPGPALEAGVTPDPLAPRASSQPAAPAEPPTPAEPAAPPAPSIPAAPAVPAAAPAPVEPPASTAPPAPAQPASKTSPPPSPPKTPARVDSRSARQDDSYSLSVGGAYFNVLGLGVGGFAGFYLDPDLLIELDLFAGAAVVPDARATRDFGLGLRFFWGNSGYLRTGLRYRDYTSDNWIGTAVADVFTGVFMGELSETKNVVQVRDMGVFFAFGNRWQAGGFTFGVDWFGVFFPTSVLEAEGVLQRRDDGQVVARTKLKTTEVTPIKDVRIAHFQFGTSF